MSEDPCPWDDLRSAGRREVWNQLGDRIGTLKSVGAIPVLFFGALWPVVCADLRNAKKYIFNDYEARTTGKSIESNKPMENEKEIEQENTKSGLGGLVKKITALIGGRLVYGGLLMFLGVRIVIDPNSAPKKIAWGLGLAILIATVGLLIGYITTKSFNRENLVPILETIAFTVLGVCMIIFDWDFGAVLQEVLFVAVIVNSITNLICLRDLNDIHAKIEARRAKKNRDKVIQSVDRAVKEDFEKYNGELIHVVGKIKKKADATLWGQVILNLALIIVSFVMLASRFSDTAPIYQISGFVLIVSGLNEVGLVVRGYLERKRAREAEM